MIDFHGFGAGVAPIYIDDGAVTPEQTAAIYQSVKGWEIGGVSCVPTKLWHEDTPRVIRLLALYHYLFGYGGGCDNVIRCDFVIIT
jgi:hypothetical protein